jgi:hypothetical protein
MIHSFIQPVAFVNAHRILGHSTNIQGDMQLEAQLVTNGLYCGDPSGYNRQVSRQQLVRPRSSSRRSVFPSLEVEFQAPKVAFFRLLIEPP